MKAKRVAALALSVITAMSMVACGSDAAGGSASGDAAGTDAPQEMQGSVEGELTVSIWDENQRPGLQKILDEWSAQSGVKATIQVVGWDDYWTLLEAGASGGELPDVFWMHSNQAQKYMENDMLMDLTDKIAASDKIDMGNYYEGIVNLYQSGGKQYAVPKDIDTIALWYNKTIFDECGVAYPDESWTWDDFADAAKKLTTDEHWGYAIAPSNNQDSFYNMVYSMGGEIISEDKKTSGYDKPETQKAIQMCVDLVQEGSCPDLNTISESAADVLFESGKVAMITQGSWMVAAFKDNEYTAANCDVAVLPKDATTGKRVSIYNGLGWAASANTKNPDAAWSLIEWLGSKEMQEKQAELGVTMSAYEGCSDLWVNCTDVFDLSGHMDMLDADLVFRPYSKYTTVWEDMQTEKLKEAWTGEKDVPTVCQEIADSMNQTLSEE